MPLNLVYKKYLILKKKRDFFFLAISVSRLLFLNKCYRGLNALKTMIFRCIETVDLYKACLGFHLLIIRLLKIKSLMSRILKLDLIKIDTCLHTFILIVLNV